MENKRRPAPEEGPNGVDRWTSNGYGLIVNGKAVEKPDDKPDTNEVDEIEEV